MDGHIGVFSNRDTIPRDVLEFQGETGLLLRYDRNFMIPFPTKQGNRPSSPVEEGENVGLLELWLDPRCSSLMGNVYIGEFLELLHGCQGPFQG